VLVGVPVRLLQQLVAGSASGVPLEENSDPHPADTQLRAKKPATA